MSDTAKETYNTSVADVGASNTKSLSVSGSNTQNTLKKGITKKPASSVADSSAKDAKNEGINSALALQF